MRTQTFLKAIFAVLVVAGVGSVVYGQSPVNQDTQSPAIPVSQSTFLKTNDAVKPVVNIGALTPDAAAEYLVKLKNPVRAAARLAQLASSKAAAILDSAKMDAATAAIMLRSMRPAKAAAILKLCNPVNAGFILSNPKISDGVARKLLYAVADLKANPAAFSNILNYMAWRNPARVARIVNAMKPADAAAAMRNFHPETLSFVLKDVDAGKAAYILSNINTDTAAYAFGMVDFVSQDVLFTSYTSEQLAAIVVKMDPAKTAAIVANDKLSVDDAATILGKAKVLNEPVVKNILTEVDKLNAAKATQIRDKIGLHILGTAIADFDLDGNGKFEYADVQYMFNHMDTLTVAQADFNHNNRIDFADVVLMNNKLQEVNNTFALTVGGSGLEYRVSSDSKSVTTVAVGMSLHTSPLTMDYATGTISYIPYPNSWDDESKRISVTKAGDPVQYANLKNIMISEINTVLTQYASSLTDQQKTQLTYALSQLQK